MKHIKNQNRYLDPDTSLRGMFKKALPWVIVSAALSYGLTRGIIWVINARIEGMLL
jgi:hypothetical protein